MKKIDQEYNKRFSNQELPNGDFDVDGLWDDISGGLDGIPASTQNTWRNTWWFFGAMLFVIIGVVYFFFQNPSEILSSTDADTKESNLKHDVKPENKIKNVNEILIRQDNAIIESSLNTVQNKYIQDKNYKNSNSIIDKNEFVSLEIVENKNDFILSENSIVDHKNMPVQIYKGNLKTSVNPHNNSYNIKLNKVEQEQSQNENRNSSTDIPTVLTSQKEEVKYDYSNEVSTPILNAMLSPLALEETLIYKVAQEMPESFKGYYEVDIPKPKAYSWQISLLGGVNNSLFNFKSTESSELAELKSETENGEWGVNVGLKAAMVLNNKWLLSSGLEYQNVSSIFDIVQTTNMQILKEDQIVKFLIDEISGDTIGTVLEDVLVDSVVTRTIVNHNRYQQLSIPLEIGVQKYHGDLMYGLQAGISVNFVTSQSGKTLDPSGEIVSFNSSDGFTPFRNFHIGYRVSPFIGYRVAKNWAFTFRPQLAFNPHAGFDSSDIQLRSSQFNFNVGVQYSLN